MGEEQLEGMEFKNFKDNQDFYEYLLYLVECCECGNEFQVVIEIEINEVKKVIYQEELDGLGDQVLEYQEKFIVEYFNSFLVVIIKVNLLINFLDFIGIDDEINNQKWCWMQKYYFDNIDLSDECMLCMFFFFQWVDYFV